MSTLKTVTSKQPRALFCFLVPWYFPKVITGNIHAQRIDIGSGRNSTLGDFQHQARSAIMCVALALFATACDSQTMNNLFGRESTGITNQFKTLEWTDLMPASDLEALLNPPDYVSELAEGSIEDIPASMLKSAIKEPADRYQQALTSNDVRPELDGNDIRIAGYLVPIDFNSNQEATAFFAVPFFGACLHLPPPPPNQIILVESEQGVRIDDMYTPYWISGELHTDLQENETAESAYSMTLQSFELYADP